MVHNWFHFQFIRWLSIPILTFFFIAAVPLVASDLENSNPAATENAQNLDDEPPASFRLISENNSIQPGHTFLLAIDMDLKKGWHSYWKNPGDSGMPLQIGWDLPEGITIQDIQWPTPKRFDQSGVIGYGYDDKATLLVYLQAAKLTASMKIAKIGAEVRWLACSDAFCVPGENELSLELPISAEAPHVLDANRDFFSKAQDRVPKKQWKVQARQENNLIEVKLSAPNISLPPFKNAHFFSEVKNSIDEKIEPTLTVDPLNGQYVVVIKQLETAKLTHLKGVMVLISESDEGAFSVSIEVDVPIQNSAPDASVGFADVKSTKKISALQPEAGQHEFQGGIALALLFAFLGGLILNLMPCVFPVISFKILSFVKMAGANRRTTLFHGIAFAFGVLVSFWLFAGILLLLKSYGLEAGWGFQLQQPLFVAFLASLLLVFALSLFGVFEFGVSVTAMAGDAEQKVGGHSSALVGSFFSGMLATALATPCTGPFMAPALGFAATLPAFWSMTIFTSLGLGMAFPYLLLSAFPSLLRFLPRPGAWMTTFKEIMGFLMLITVLWLLTVFAAETGILGLLLLLTGFLILSVAAWIYGRFCLPSSSTVKKYIGVAFTALFALTAIYVINLSAATEMAGGHKNESTHEGWENFSAMRLKQLRDEGKPVFIDFTAKWCLICQANHLVLSTSEVVQKLKDNNVVKMKADWTRSDPEITAMLREFGRNGVPLYVLYGANGIENPQVLPQLLTPGTIIDALENI